MKTTIQLAALLIIFSAMSGCSKFRQLTRRDYALLRDPFLDRSAVSAETAADDASGRRSDPETTGIVRLDEFGSEQPQNTAATAMTNPGAATRGGQNVDGRRATENTNAVYAGPALTDFMGQQPESTNVTTVAAGPGQPSEGMAGFAAFLEHEAEASGMSQTAQELDKDFADWAIARKDEWKRETSALDQKAARSMNPVRQVSQSATSPGVPEMPTPGAGQASAGQETAMPLIQQTAAQDGSRGVSPAAARASVPPGRTSVNPFPAHASPQVQSKSAPQPVTGRPAAPRPASADPVTRDGEQWNPFSAFERHSGPTQNPTSPDAVGNTLDNGFHFDSGWRPSNLQRP